MKLPLRLVSRHNGLPTLKFDVAQWVKDHLGYWVQGVQIDKTEREYLDPKKKVIRLSYYIDFKSDTDAMYFRMYWC